MNENLECFLICLAMVAATVAIEYAVLMKVAGIW